MTSNGTPAKPNCAEGLRAGRNEIPITQALNINTRWVVGRAELVCRRCMPVYEGVLPCVYVLLTRGGPDRGDNDMD